MILKDESEETLNRKQVQALVDYIIDGNYGSFSYMIYNVLFINYSDAYNMGLFDLNNWLNSSIEQRELMKNPKK